MPLPRKCLYWVEHGVLFLISPRSNLEEYFKHNRDIKKVQDSCKCGGEDKAVSGSKEKSWGGVNGQVVSYL